MKFFKKGIVLILIFALLLSGCGQISEGETKTTADNEEIAIQIALENFLRVDDEEAIAYEENDDANTENISGNVTVTNENITVGNTNNTVQTVNENTENVVVCASVNKSEGSAATVSASNETVQANTEKEETVEIDNGAEEKLYGASSNIVPEASSTFETAGSVDDTDWTEKVGAPLNVGIVTSDYGKCLHFERTDESAKYSSPAINLAKYIKEKGRYVISFNYKVLCSEKISPFSIAIRGDKEYSFIPKSGGNYYYSTSGVDEVVNNQWGKASLEIYVSKTDVNNANTWNLCLHQINEKLTDVYIDNFFITKTEEEIQTSLVTSTETWVANEITLVSQKDYSDPFNDVEVDLLLTNGIVTYTIPGFWDGGNVWKCRFYCTEAGTWAYKTVCSNKADKGLHNVRSKLECAEYSGDLDIYKHGLVEVQSGNKYFTYADGTPFFYLGDTHWSLGEETAELTQDMCAKRYSQGYTVIQSEPIGAQFNFTDGINEFDISGLKLYDEKFQIIANAGLAHVNASFFYPSGMASLIENFGGYSDKVAGTASHTDANKNTTEITVYDLSTSVKEYLQKICRYWVARYSAYPVMWSLGQEVDSDFFWERATFNGHEGWCYVNNPYRLVATYIHQFDAYSHPMTAHEEGMSSFGGTPEKSAFNDIAGHNWYAAQWSPTLTAQLAKDVPQAYYNSSKPTVLYEGRYCYLWAKNFGARLQGWAAFLNGMCGYGWGGQDTWSYTNTYNESSDSSDGVDTIGALEKSIASYRDSFEYKSAYQVGYMRSFFENKVGAWNELIPWFSSNLTFTASNKAYYYFATLPDNSKTVFYFYNTDKRTNLDASGATSYHELDTEKSYPYYNNSFPEKSNSAYPKNTGSVKGLPVGTYTMTWFNPVTNVYTSAGTLTVTSTTTSYSLPTKTVGQDMVLLLEKA